MTKKKSSVKKTEKVEFLEKKPKMKPKATASAEPDELDLPEVRGQGLKLKGREWARKVHEINVRFPWLKIAGVLILLGISAVGMEEVLRHSVQRPAEVAEVAEGEQAQTPTIEETVAEVKNEPEAKDEQASEESTVEEAQPVVPEKREDLGGRKLVALTFDDGPSPTTTPRLLDILKEKGVKATFFVVGNMAQRAPEVLKREKAEGHEIGSHTMTHANLKKATIEGIQWEKQAIEELFQNILGEKPSLTRPPYGSINDTVRAQIAQPLILWAVDPEDWKYKNAESVRAKVVGGTFDGAIVLMHDIHSTTVDAVGAIIDELRAAGYEFLTVSELAVQRGVAMEAGWSYGSFRP